MSDFSVGRMVEMLGDIIKRSDSKRYAFFQAAVRDRRRVYNRKWEQFNEIKDRYDETGKISDEELEWVMLMTEKLFKMCEV